MIVHSIMFLPSRDLIREEERMKTLHSLISLRYKGTLSLSIIPLHLNAEPRVVSCPIRVHFVYFSPRLFLLKEKWIQIFHRLFYSFFVYFQSFPVGMHSWYPILTVECFPLSSSPLQSSSFFVQTWSLLFLLFIHIWYLLVYSYLLVLFRDDSFFHDLHRPLLLIPFHPLSPSYFPSIPLHSRSTVTLQLTLLLSSTQCKLIQMVNALYNFGLGFIFE